MIEISHGQSVFVYRVNPSNPRLVDRKRNKHRAQWQPFCWYYSAEAAAKAILEIERDDEGDDD